MRVCCRLAAFCLAACLLLMGISCSSKPMADQPFSYADKAFSATIRGTLTRLSLDGYTGSPALVGTPLTGIPQPIAATVAIGEKQADGRRDMTVTFSEPPALAGISVMQTTPTPDVPHRVTLTRATAAGTVTLDDTTAPGCYDALLRYAEALLPQGDIAIVSPLSDGCRTITCVEGMHKTTFTFMEGRTLPIHVSMESTAERLELTVD